MITYLIAETATGLPSTWQEVAGMAVIGLFVIGVIHGWPFQRSCDCECEKEDED